MAPWYLNVGLERGRCETKPYIHGKNSVKRWGGKIDDYQAIHDFLDSSKAHVADMRHRAILHSSFGIYIAEKVFGEGVTTSDGLHVSVRDVCEQHIIEDLGRIPSVQEYLEGMPKYEWLGGVKRKASFIPFDVDCDLID